MSGQNGAHEITLTATSSRIGVYVRATRCEWRNSSGSLTCCPGACETNSSANRCSRKDGAKQTIINYEEGPTTRF